MKLELTEGITYTVPDEILRTCKTIRIGYSRFEVELFQCSKYDRQKIMLRRNKGDLEGYIHIGCQELEWDNLVNFYIEVHWFIPKDKLSECRCDISDRKPYKVLVTN